jgi:RNA polymerase sigma-70 factor (ECF subfamily)
LPRQHHVPTTASDSDAAEGGIRSDAQLLAGLRAGSETDFNVLYERYFHRVFAYVYSRLRNRADSEEVVQETFTAVFRSAEACRGQSSLLSWIYGIAKNNVNNHHRRARAHAARIERAEQELLRAPHRLDTCTPEEQLHLRRYERAIQERLSSIADWHAEVFVLRHMENLPIGEIALRVSRSNDAVRSSLYRVKRLLVDAAQPGSNVVN